MKSAIGALLFAASTALALPTEPAGPPPTPAPEPVSVAGSGKWGVVGALTAPANANVAEGGLGWPGLHAAFRRGINNQLEVGGQFSLNYGVEGMVGPIVPGLKFQFLLRYKLFDNGKISVAARFEPGPLFYFYPGNTATSCFIDGFGNLVCGRGTLGGFAIPFGARLGIAASSAINAGVSFDLPMWFSFGRNPLFYAPILMGLGVEYFLQSNLLLTVHMKMGPTLSNAAPVFGGSTAVFTFEAKLGAAYRF